MCVYIWSRGRYVVFRLSYKMTPYPTHPSSPIPLCLWFFFSQQIRRYYS